MFAGHTAASAGLSPPHACKQRSWEEQLAGGQRSLSSRIPVCQQCRRVPGRDAGYPAPPGQIRTCALARELGWDVVQLDPPHRASRYLRHDGRLRAVHPDAFGILRRGDTTWPFFLEWERRSVRPVAMSARLAPYLRYYASQRPADDYGTRPAVLVVFEDEVAAIHFLLIARGELDGTGLEMQLGCRTVACSQVSVHGHGW